MGKTCLQQDDSHQSFLILSDVIVYHRQFQDIDICVKDFFKRWLDRNFFCNWQR